MAKRSSAQNRFPSLAATAQWPGILALFGVLNLTRGNGLTTVGRCQAQSSSTSRVAQAREQQAIILVLASRSERVSTTSR